MVSQLISIENIRSTGANGEVEFEVIYDTEPRVELTSGLNLRFHFNSDHFQINRDNRTEAIDILAPNFQGLGNVTEDEDNFDGLDETDQFILFPWATPQNAQWPGELPITLFTATVETTENFSGTQIGFSTTDDIIFTNVEANPGGEQLTLEEPVQIEIPENTSLPEEEVTPPVIIPDDSIVVSEEIEIGDEIFQVEATSETSNELTFRFTDEISTFDLDPETGIITLSETVAVGDEFNLEVIATDEEEVASNPETFTVIIASPLEITSPATVEITENETTVLTLTADTNQPNDQITYEITGGENAGLFEIIPETGELSLRNPPELTSSEETYQVEVTATNNEGLSDEQAINVNVTADIDNLPTEETLQADLNGDGIVDLEDLRFFSPAFGSTQSDDNFNPIADLTGDGLINLNDLGIIASEFNLSP